MHQDRTMKEEMRLTRKPHIKDEKSIVQWCSATMSDRTIVQHTSIGVGSPVKNFWHVVDIDQSHSYSCDTIQGTRGFHSVRSSNNPQFEIWTQKLACFCSPSSNGEWDECECMDWVDDWDRVSLAVDPRVVGETTHLEDVQLVISTDYDHISYLVQPGHIYAVVAPKDNEWGTNYWLARCIRGKKILNV